MADGLNIPSGEGLLEAQQQTAAAIPYKNIEAAQDSFKGVMNTFMMAQQVGNKRRQLEQQLQMAYMKNDLDERKFGMQMDNMATRHAIQVASLEQRAAHQGDMLEMAGRGMELREANAELDRKKFDFTVDKYNDRVSGTEAILDVFGGLADEGITEKDPKYFPELSSRMANSRAVSMAPASTVNRAMSMAKKKVNDTADLMLKDNITQRKAFAEEVGTTVFGDPKFQDLRFLESPGTLTDESAAGDQSFMDRWFWNKPPPEQKPTGNKVYKYMTSAGEQQAVISSKRLAELNKKYNEIFVEAPKKIPPRQPISPEESETVTIRTSDGREGPIPKSNLPEAKRRDPGIVILP